MKWISLRDLFVCPNRRITNQIVDTGMACGFRFLKMGSSRLVRSVTCSRAPAAFSGSRPAISLILMVGPSQAPGSSFFKVFLQLGIVLFCLRQSNQFLVGLSY